MGYFHCNISAQCVPQRLNCDEKADCDDASDEWNCVNEVDAKFWDHFFRKQPYGRHDDVPVETCCKCRGPFVGAYLCVCVCVCLCLLEYGNLCCSASRMSDT